MKAQANFSSNQQYKTYQKILSENHQLEKYHQNNINDLQNYKKQLEEFEEKINKNESIILILSKENENLKLKHKEKLEENHPEKIIRTPIDIRQSFGFNLKTQENKEEKEEEGSLTSEEMQKEFDKLKQQKADSEKTFKINQEKVINYSKEIDTLKTYAENYSSYIDSINEQIRSFNQQTKVSLIGEEKINFYKSCEDKIKQLTKEIEQVTSTIKATNEIINSLEITTLKEAENSLTNIDSKLEEINNNTNIDYNFLSIRINSISISLLDLNKTIEALQTQINSINGQNKTIDKCIDDIKINLQKLMESYKEGKKKLKETIKKTMRKTGKDILNSIKKSIKNEKMEKNEEELIDKIEEVEETEIDNNLLKSSTLIGVKDFGKNKDLFKTTVLFNDKDIDKEDQNKEPTIFKKNWHEVCYIYDEYDIHDINFEIRATGLDAYTSYSSYYLGFVSGKDYEILELEVNGQKREFEFDDYYLIFNIYLRNLQTAKVHVKYKEMPFFGDEKERIKYGLCRKVYYSLSKSLSGKMAKLSIILKGSLDIVGFKEDFLIPNKKNKKEKEYFWGGKVPEGGIKTLVTLSKKEATWAFNCKYELKTGRRGFKNTTLIVPLRYTGGNNEIIKMNYSSPQTKNIVVDDEKRNYEVKYKNSTIQKGVFSLTGEFKNRSSGDWEVDLSDKIIEAHIPKEDKRDKKKLQNLAKKIIEDFDKKNKNSMLDYKDYAKIGKWVNENIKYDLSYITRIKMTAIDIYNKRRGVCHHMTRLSNALLYSLGYKVIYIYGFSCRDKPEFDPSCKHAWSIVKVEGKWYPFDATLGIVTGKLPVTHIFQGYFSDADNIEYEGRDTVSFGELTENGKYIA